MVGKDTLMTEVEIDELVDVYKMLFAKLVGRKNIIVTI